MKKIITFMFLLLLPLFSFSSDIKDLNLKTLDAKVKKLDSYKGKTYVKLWASWCPVCLATMDHTLELSQDKNKDFNVTTIVSPGHAREQREESFKKWYNGTDWEKLEVLMDLDGKMINKVALRGYPTNVFIDSKGKIVRTVAGPLSNAQIKKIMSTIK